MKQDWHPDELAQHWTLSTDERQLLVNKTGATRLSFAVLLKSFQLEGRFPDTREEIAASIVSHLAIQAGVPPEAFLINDGGWSERTERHQRSQIRERCGFRVFHAEDEPMFIQWLSERVASPNPDAEEFRLTAYEHLREQHIEPPGAERLHRLLRLAVAQHEERLVTDTAVQLSPTVCSALDALLKTESTEPEGDGDQMALFVVRSDLASVKDNAGAVSVETVLDEISKLQQLRVLGLPEELFRDAPARLVTHYRQRAASEPPRELRRHPPNVCHTLLAALCWQREQEITDNLVELLIHIAHRIGVVGGLGEYWLNPMARESCCVGAPKHKSLSCFSVSSLRVNDETYSRPSILVVEDDQELRDGLARLLRGQEWSVVPARSSADAVAFTKCRPDLILTPVNQSEMATLELARTIRKQIDEHEDIPIVIFSAQSIPEGGESELRDRVYLIRPETFNQLKTLIARVLSH